jgi:Ca2+-binding EF-hand superfamily protein
MSMDETAEINEIRKIFHTLDTNKNGVLSHTEIAECMKKLREGNFLSSSLISY